jgi:hypothetical protein
VIDIAAPAGRAAVHRLVEMAVQRPVAMAAQGPVKIAVQAL